METAQLLQLAADVSTDSDDRPNSMTQSASPSYTTASGRRVPGWILTMLGCKFFCACPAHREYKKNECTYYCVDCQRVAAGLCQHCLPTHEPAHTIIQIRRYVYCDVVRVHDIQQHMDTSGVQSYVINQAKVVFLRHRPQPKQHRAAHGDVCLTCNRLLREGCRFCSLGCKVSWMASGSHSTARNSPAAAFPDTFLDERLQSIRLANSPSPSKRPKSALSAVMVSGLHMKAGHSALPLVAYGCGVRKHSRKQFLPQRSPAF